MNGGEIFLDVETLDARIESALTKIIISTSFKRRVSAEEQRAQTQNRFLRGRQIAYMIHDHCQASGAYDAARGLADLFIFCLQNDDVQDSDTRWDQILFGTSELPHENVLEGLYKMRLQGSEQLQTVLALYNHEKNRDTATPSCQRLRTMVRQHVGQMIGTRNFKAQNERFEEKSAWRGKWENAFSGMQLNVRKETPVVFSAGPILVKEHNHPLLL